MAAGAFNSVRFYVLTFSGLDRFVCVLLVQKTRKKSFSEDCLHRTAN
uniref:Uncharacterized protein n=1 Tax=Ciona intestinalis TaxID=7719 RepID=H2XRI5_CIOIN